MNKAMERVEREFDMVEERLGSILELTVNLQDSNFPNRVRTGACQHGTEPIPPALVPTSHYSATTTLPTTSTIPATTESSESQSSASSDTPASKPRKPRKVKPQVAVKPSPPDLIEKNGNPLWRCAISDWDEGDPE